MALRSRKRNEKSDDGLVQIMTISLFIILLAFFILLNSIARIDEKKIRRVVTSIVENFGGTMPAPAGGEQPEDVFTDNVSPLDLEALKSSDLPELKDVKLKVDSKSTTLSIPNDLLFSRYGTRLGKKGEAVLKNVVAIIKANPVPVEISSHTDNIPLDQRGETGNRELTTLRSMRVMEYMVSRGKVPPEQLTAFGWGMEKPTAPNTTSRTRKMNNRIDVRLSHDKNLNKTKGFFIFKDFFFNVKDKD